MRKQVKLRLGDEFDIDMTDYDYEDLADFWSLYRFHKPESVFEMAGVA